jgi:hypothetical protein
MSEDPTSGDPSMLDVRRVPWSAGDVMPWVGPDPGSGDRDQPVLVVNPTGAGSVVVQAEDGRRVNVRLGRNGVARFGERLSVFDLTGATITLRTPAGRTVLREELPKLYGQDVSLFN